MWEFHPDLHIGTGIMTNLVGKVFWFASFISFYFIILTYKKLPES